jgi:hypothetical protein
VTERVEDDLTRQLDALTARLAKLEDERAILDTLHCYGQTIDYGLEADWVDCFTEDARRESRRRLDPSTTTVCVGSGELKEFVSRHSRAPAKYHKHIVTGARVEVDGECGRATAVSYFLKVDDDPAGGRPCIQAMGRYLDTLVRCPDGKWRIQERIAEVENL